MSRHAIDLPAHRSRLDADATRVLHIDRAALRIQAEELRLRGSTPRTQVLALTGRALRSSFGDYRLVLFGLLQPVVILLLFSQVFQALSTMPGVAEYDGYINYLLPATLVMIAVTTAMGSGVAVLTETYTGFVGRLRTMPVSLIAVLVARTLADAVRLAVQLIVAVLTGVFLLGFSPGGVVGLTGAIVLTVIVGWGLSWLFVAIATWQTKPELMQAASFIVMFPLMFGSSAYLPVEAMPTWIRVVSTINPLTYAIDATRALAVGKPVGYALLAALGLAAAAAAIGGLAAARTFTRRP